MNSFLKAVVSHVVSFWISDIADKRAELLNKLRVEDLDCDILPDALAFHLDYLDEQKEQVLRAGKVLEGLNAC